MLSNSILRHPTYKKLVSYNTYSHKAITDISDLTISSYLTSIGSNREAHENTYLKIAIQALENHLSQILDKSELELVIEEFRKFPAIQVADHIGLFYDSTNFLNNFLWNISLENNDIKYIFTSQCETVRAVQDVQNFFGPGYIELNENVYNIFGLSRNKLKNINVAALDDCRFLFELVLGEKEIHFPDILEDIIRTSQEPGYAPDMFRKANLLFWSSMKYSNKRKMVLFDRRYFSDILAENIAQEAPLLDAMLFASETRKSFLEIKNRIIESPENLVLRNTTDFFYLKKGKELVPLKISDEGVFYDGRSGDVVIINGETLRADKKIISEALLNRQIYPDLVLSNIFGHILPNIIAMGGTSQLEYLPIIGRMLDEYLSRNKLYSESEMEKLRNGNFGRLIGPSLLTLSQSEKKFIENLDTDSDLEEFKASFCDRRIGDVLNIKFWNYFEVFYSRLNKT